MVDEKQEEYTLSVSDREQVWAPTAEKQNMFLLPVTQLQQVIISQLLVLQLFFEWHLDSSAVKSQTCNQRKLTMHPQTIPGL